METKWKGSFDIELGEDVSDTIKLVKVNFDINMTVKRDDKDK